MKAGFANDEYTHIGSFRRQLYIHPIQLISNKQNTTFFSMMTKFHAISVSRRATHLIIVKRKLKIKSKLFIATILTISPI